MQAYTNVISTDPPNIALHQTLVNKMASKQYADVGLMEG